MKINFFAKLNLISTTNIGFVVITGFFFQQCGNIDPPENGKENIYVVLCDLTTSLDSTSISRVASVSKKILKEIPDGSKVCFYELNDNHYKQAFYEEKIARFSTTLSEEKKMLEKNKQNADSLELLILNKGKEYTNESLSNQPNSCIVGGLRKASTFLRDEGSQDTSKYNYWVIILSDMLEECNSSPLGSTFMKPEYLSTIDANIEKYNPDFDLSYANVRVCLTSENNSKKNAYLRNEQLEEVWQKIFKKLGIGEDEMRNIFPFREDLRNYLPK